MSDTTTTTTPRAALVPGEATQSDELRAWAKVIKPALCILLQFWTLNGERYPASHPYRQAATMVIRFLEGRYGV